MKSITPYVKAGFGALFIVSHEEQRIEAVIHQVATELNRSLYAWSCTSGIMAVLSSSITPGTTIDADNYGVLEEIAGDGIPEESIILLRDFHLYFTDPDPGLIRKFKDAVYKAKTKQKTVLILGPVFKMPPELEKLITVVEIDLPDRETIAKVLSDLSESTGIPLPDESAVSDLLDAASGLTTTEAEDAFSLSLVEKGAFDAPTVAREKAQAVKKDGLLEFVESKITLENVGGLEPLKQWLVKRRAAFSPEARAYGLPTPKGTLLVGIPGTGKSLTAKACSAALGNIPLLKLDGGRIFGSLVGESEANLRKVMQTAEAIAPCVLWLDEVEKAFSGSKSSGSTDGGTSARVLGSFLQWMNDKTANVFVFATANDVTALPPEFLRKGRFDELWFVDLPNAEDRRSIWSVVFKRYNRKFPESDIMDALVKATDGFTGAEIDAVFTEALYDAFENGNDPDAWTIGRAIEATVPLSKTMADEISRLRDWASTRARRASAEEVKTPTPSLGKRKLSLT